MATDTEIPPVIRTKLYRPRISGDLIPRPRLLERLEKRRERPLTLVLAPTGYGKTTLVATWLEGCDWPNAWLSLDEGDDDPFLFLSYFLAAVRTIFPTALQETLALLHNPGPAPTETLLYHLVNELDRIESPFVLVLDDYHQIQNMAVHDMVTDLLRHPPRPLHLVLISRNDPPLPLARLRAQGLATEIRAHDLRFTQEETAALLRQMGMSADDEAIRAILQKAEGWPAGIRLAVLSSRHRGNETLLPAHLEGGISYIMDYLLTEVVENQPQAIQDYLLRTSILDRFCASLCEAVCLGEAQGNPSTDTPEGRAPDGRAYLEWLEGSDLFVVPLDDRHEWYRYHHLFRQLLRHQLERRHSPQEIAALHRRASDWFARHDMIEAAIRHALAAGDALQAARLVEQKGRALLTENRWRLLKKWLDMLPPDLIQDRPLLLIAQAWVAYFRFALGDIPPLLQRLEQILAEDETARFLQEEIDFFWGHHWYWKGQMDRSLARLERARDREPVVHHVSKGITQVFWALAAQMSGRKEEAVRYLRQALDDAPLSPSIPQNESVGTLILVHLLSGELHRAARLVPRGQELATRSGNLYARSWYRYIQGYLAYFWHDLEQAISHLAAAIERRYILYTRASLDALSGLALSQQLLGEQDQAEATLALLRDFAQECDEPEAVIVARSCEAHLALLRGEPDVALRRLRMADLPIEGRAMFTWIEVPQITYCRALIALGGTSGLQEAEKRLQTCRRVNEAQYNTRQLLDILILQSMVHYRQGHTETALTELERAVVLAEPGGWVHPFVEPGPPIAEMLTRIHRRSTAAGFVSRLLAACAQDAAPSFPSPPLPEPLTNREMEILELLARRLTNKEIAALLTISPGTVRQHTHNIYQKLEVKSRRQAVDKAVALGLLSPSGPRRNAEP